MVEGLVMLHPGGSKTPTLSKPPVSSILPPFNTAALRNTSKYCRVLMIGREEFSVLKAEVRRLEAGVMNSILSLASAFFFNSHS